MSSTFSQLPSAATHSSLDLFQKPPVLINFDYGSMQEVHTKSGIDGPTLDFEIQTDRNCFLDMSEVYLRLYVRIVNLTTGKTIDTTTDKIMLANNSLHSLFDNCEVSLNGEQISTSNGLYAHKAFVTTEWSHPSSCKDSVLQCQGYSIEEDPANLTGNFKEASAETDDLFVGGVTSGKYYLFGKLAVDFFTCDKLLVPKSLLRIRLQKSTSTNFVLKWCGDDNANEAVGYAVKWEKASLYTKQMTVSENIYASIEKALLRTPARYTYTDTIAKTFIIPAGQSTFVRENVLDNKPIRSLAIAFNTNEAFRGNKRLNPFHYQTFGLQRIVVYRNGQALFDNSLRDGGLVQLYHNTVRNLHYKHDGPGIGLRNYKDHFVVVYDLTSTAESNNEIYYPELVGGSIRLELTFEKALDKSVEVFLLGEQLNTVYVKSTGEVNKDG